MRVLTAIKLAQTLLREFDLEDVELKLTNAKRYIGRACFNDDFDLFMELSRPFIKVLNRDQLELVILHEIAHFKAGIDAGHGPKWRAACIAIGAVPTECAEDVDPLDPKYEAVCTKCGKVVREFYAKPRRNWSHSIHGDGCGGRLKVRLFK